MNKLFLKWDISRKQIRETTAYEQNNSHTEAKEKNNLFTLYSH